SNGRGTTEMQGAFGGGVQETKTARAVKGQQGRWHGRDHAVHESERVHGGVTLPLQRAGECVDLECKVTHGITLTRAAGSEGVVLLPQPSDGIGECLEPARDALVEEGSDDNP